MLAIFRVNSGSSVMSDVSPSALTITAVKSSSPRTIISEGFLVNPSLFRINCLRIVRYELVERIGDDRERWVQGAQGTQLV